MINLVEQRTRVILVSAAVIITLLGSFAWVRAEGTTITACVKSTGVVYIIGSGFHREDCGSRDQLLTWSIQGPQGPVGATGPVGPQGETGPVGPQGDPGQAGSFASTPRYVKTTDTRIPPSTEFGGVTTGYTYCDAGDTLISGGAKVNFDDARILGNFPFGIAAWRGDVSNQGPVEKILTVFALCADTTP